MDKKLGEITSMLRRGLTANRYQDAGNRTFKRKNMSTVECYRCHDIGHYATDCPMRQAAASESVAKKQENYVGQRQTALRWSRRVKM